VDDRIRQAAQTTYQALIEAELTAVIGAAPHERTPDRLAQRNGHRARVLSTTAGDLELRIPKLRAGSFFPSLLERRRRVDQALFAVVTEAYLHGVGTRKVDDLVRALGADSGTSKSEVSRTCGDHAQRERNSATTGPTTSAGAPWSAPRSTVSSPSGSSLAICEAVSRRKLGLASPASRRVGM
jgi:transposase-like protein